MKRFSPKNCLLALVIVHLIGFFGLQSSTTVIHGVPLTNHWGQRGNISTDLFFHAAETGIVPRINAKIQGIEPWNSDDETKNNDGKRFFTEPIFPSLEIDPLADLNFPSSSDRPLTLSRGEFSSPKCPIEARHPPTGPPQAWCSTSVMGTTGTV